MRRRSRRLRASLDALLLTSIPDIEMRVGDERMLTLCLRRYHPSQEPRRDHAGLWGSARARGSTSRCASAPSLRDRRAWRGAPAPLLFARNHRGCRPLDRPITTDCLSQPPDFFFSVRCAAAPASVLDPAPGLLTATYSK